MGVSQEAVARVPRLEVAESVADVAALAGEVERLEVATETSAAVRLCDKIVEIGKNLPGIRDWLLGMAEEAVVDLEGVWEEMSVARAALEKVEYHVSAKVPMLGSDEKGVWVGVNNLRWEIIAARGEKKRSLKREQETYLENRRLLGEVKQLEAWQVLRGVGGGAGAARG